MLTVASLFPAIASVAFYLLERKTAFGHLSYPVRQMIIGVVFGGIAIIGTEWGIPLNGAMVNCRDAAPLCAGLLFGGPAGILAGVIGGAERWIAVRWGVGTFTRVACSVSTVLAGFFAAALRKHMFDNKKPSWPLAFAIGAVMEVFHLTMVFVTNMANESRAAEVVRACAIPMVTFNSLSVMLSTLLLSFLSREKRSSKPEKLRITQTVQLWLLVCVLVAFLITSLFTFTLQDGLMNNSNHTLLSQGLQDVEDAVAYASDENILTLARRVEEERAVSTIDELAEIYDIPEIVVVNEKGIITEATNRDFIGYDMASGQQSLEFMILLGGRVTELVQDFGPISYDQSISLKFAGIATDTGFLQIGYDAERSHADIMEEIINASRHRHVGRSGFFLVAEENGRLLYAPEGTEVRTLSELGLDLENHFANTVFESAVNGEDCFCMYGREEKLICVAVLPAQEAISNRSAALYANTFMEVLTFAALFAVIYFLIKHIVVDNIRSINKTLSQITDGNLDLTVNVRSSEEFASLSDDINSTVTTLKRYIAEAAARIDSELEFARSIQHSALPNVFPAFPQRTEFDIYALMLTAKEVGGDFYDFYLSQDSKLYFLVADVSGKGIPAAMFMMRAKTQLKSLAENGIPLDEVFNAGNRNLCEGNDAGMFVTAWMGALDLNTGLVQYVNAGHNPPLVRHGDGSFEYLRSRAGFVLGGMDTVRYRLQELTLQPGDVIFLYTDGVTEATDSREELFGEDRLLSTMNTHSFESMEDICRNVKTDVDAFVADAQQFDDITMLALRFFGHAPEAEFYRENAVIADIPKLTALMEKTLETLDCPMKVLIQLCVAIDEIYSNICKFSYPDGTGPAWVRLERTAERSGVMLIFTDEGVPYNPVKKENPDVTLRLEDRQIGGLGIFMVKKTMDDMIYEYRNNRNVLTLVKYF